MQTPIIPRQHSRVIHQYDTDFTDTYRVVIEPLMPRFAPVAGLCSGQEALGQIQRPTVLTSVTVAPLRWFSTPSFWHIDAVGEGHPITTSRRPSLPLRA